MAKSILVEILGSATGFASELDKAAGKTRAFGKAAGVAGLAIAGGLAYGLEKSVKAASEAEVSTARMDQAFKSVHVSADAYAGAIGNAEQAGRKLGFMNTDMRQSLGSLVVATHSGSESIKDLSVAEDLARFKSIPLADATKMITMAMGGSTRAAHQLGIQVVAVKTAQTQVANEVANATAAVNNQFAGITKLSAAQLKQKDTELAAIKTHYASIAATASVTDKQATAAKVIAEVTDKVHGQAQAFAGTAQGQMQAFHAQTEALEESLGEALLPALQSVTGALATAAGYLAKHTTLAKILVGALAGLAAVLMTVSVASKVAAAAETILDAAMDANPIGLVVIALAALAAGFVYAWEHSKTFRDVVLGVWSDVKTATMTFVDFFTQKIPEAFDTVLNWVRGHWKTIAVLISGPFAPLVALATNAFGVRSKLESAFSAIKSFASTVWGAIAGAVSTAAGLFVSGIQPIISVVKTVISWLRQLWSWASKASGILGKIGGLAGKIGGLASHIPHLAAGGVVTSPTFAMIGEAGPEAVVPLTGNGRVQPLRSSGGGGGGVVLNVNLNGPVFGDKAQVAREIGQEIALQLRGGRIVALQTAISGLPLRNFT